MGSETVLYSAASNKFCILNETAAFLWDLLDRPHTEDELIDEVCRGFEDAEPSVVKLDVRQSLQQFEELQLVTTEV